MPVVFRYALMPVDGNGIAVATVAAMLDNGAGGAQARVLAPGEVLPYGTVPVLVTDTTVYGVTRLEETLLRWGPLPRPWLVWVADAPTRPVQDARFTVRALEGRLAGVAKLPYLPVLRSVKGPEEALEYKDVQTAAARLRHTIEGK
jgi:Flp pilus assembly protein CpaB